MGAAEMTMEARQAAITASLNESRALLASCARRLGVKEQEREATKASVATMTTSLLASDPGRAKPKTKPSSPSFVSADRVVAAGALHGGAVVTPTMPTRCSTLGSAVNVSNKPAVLAFPASGMTHLPAPTLNGAGDRALHGPVDCGMNTPAGCSTYVLTSPREGFLDAARTVNTDRPCNNSFPRFDGTNPGLWREKCLEFFTKFNICKPFWTTAARMHMVGKAKEWLEEYRMHQVVGAWPEFIDDVEAHFGAGDLPPSTTTLGAAHPGVDVHGSGDSSPNVMHTTVESTKPIAASYAEVLTHVGGVSLFLEHSEQPVKLVFSQLHNMELEGQVFPTVGGLSVFLEEGSTKSHAHSTDASHGELVFPAGDATHTPAMTSFGAGNCKLQGVGCMVTHIGGSSLFLEHSLEAKQKLEGKVHTHLDRAGWVVGLVSRVEVKLQQPWSRERKQHGMNNPTVLLPWDRGKQEVVVHDLYLQRCHSREDTVPTLPWNPGACCLLQTVARNTQLFAQWGPGKHVGCWLMLSQYFQNYLQSILGPEFCANTDATAKHWDLAVLRLICHTTLRHPIPGFSYIAYGVSVEDGRCRNCPVHKYFPTSPLVVLCHEALESLVLLVLSPSELTFVVPVSDTEMEGYILVGENMPIILLHVHTVVSLVWLSQVQQEPYKCCGLFSWRQVACQLQFKQWDPGVFEMLRLKKRIPIQKLEIQYVTTCACHCLGASNVFWGR